MNSIVQTKTAKTNKLYATLANFNKDETIKISSKAYKIVTEFDDSVVLSIMQILAKMQDNTDRTLQSIQATLAKNARISAFKNKTSNLIAREFVDYKKLATEDKIVSAVNILITLGENFAYTLKEDGLHVARRKGLLFCSLQEKCIRQSEETGKYYVSQCKKTREKIETKIFLDSLANSIDYKEFNAYINKALKENKEFATCISNETARKAELAKFIKENLSGLELSDISDNAIDSQEFEPEEFETIAK